jgi:hypothetical protein
VISVQKFDEIADVCLLSRDRIEAFFNFARRKDKWLWRGREVGWYVFL